MPRHFLLRDLFLDSFPLGGCKLIVDCAMALAFLHGPQILLRFICELTHLFQCASILLQEAECERAGEPGGLQECAE